ncbi:hypothetical protein NIES267_09760 [Calothrix parasitica NIES-267]|uniref:Lipoprotein n=1 Tax=Calothrix parasitica NIES-267 TaxID=1973488 RepID=A0A1Z4LK02_9CYAN|nr:hypothetical protein NIES267_09760 [Calothrix parasitica NIES-267]
MKKSNSVYITLAVSTLIMFSAGCRSLGKYTDDAGEAIIKHGDNIIVRNGDETVDAVKGFRGQSNKVANQFTNEALELIKKRVKSCEKGVIENVLKESINTAISSVYTQISVNFLLNESKKAIGNCAEIKVGRTVHDTLLMESASSTVNEVETEFQGRIEFIY